MEEALAEQKVKGRRMVIEEVSEDEEDESDENDDVTSSSASMTTSSSSDDVDSKSSEKAPVRLKIEEVEENGSYLGFESEV